MNSQIKTNLADMWIPHESNDLIFDLETGLLVKRISGSPNTLENKEANSKEKEVDAKPTVKDCEDELVIIDELKDSTDQSGEDEAAVQDSQSELLDKIIPEGWEPPRESEIDLIDEDIAKDFEEEEVEVLALDEETLEENLAEQKDEMECLVSIYGDDYGIVSDNAFIIKISSGRFAVRLQVTFPQDYPSQSPPEPLILGAYWKEFKTEEVLESLHEMFSAGCTVVYDWTMYIQEYLQYMLERKAMKVLENNDTKELTFKVALIKNRVKLELLLKSEHLSDMNGWVQNLAYAKQKKLLKILQKRKEYTPDKILKKAKKVVPSITPSRMYWFLSWVLNSMQKVDLPHSLKSKSASSLRSDLHVAYISKCLSSFVFFETNHGYTYVIILGEKRDEAKNLLDIAIFQHYLQEFIPVWGPAVKPFIKRDSAVFGVFYKFIKFFKADFSVFAQELSEYQALLGQFTQDLEAAKNHYNMHQKRHISRAYVPYSYGTPAISAGNNLNQFFSEYTKKNKKVVDMGPGHKFLKLGSKRRGGKVVYHGTPAGNAKSIIKSGLRVNGGRSSPANGAAYGRGIYTSPDVNIPFSYAGKQALSVNGTKWLCIFEAVAKSGNTVSNGIFLVPNDRDITITGLHFYQTS